MVLPFPLVQVPDGTRPQCGEVARVALALLFGWIIPALVLQPLKPELTGQVSTILFLGPRDPERPNVFPCPFKAG